MRDWTLYDGIEVAGCVNEGGYEWIRDFKHYNSAVRYANKLSARHELWILDCVQEAA